VKRNRSEPLESPAQPVLVGNYNAPEEKPAEVLPLQPTANVALWFGMVTD